MEPNATPTPAGNPAITKAVDAVAKGLAVLYKECHKAEPDSPACEAVMALQKAVAEIDRMTGGDGVTPAEQSMPPDPGSMSQSQTFDQAGMRTADAMQAGAQERADAQAQMAGM